MATEAIKSASITNLDAVPVVPNTAGRGAAGNLQNIDGYASVTSGVTTGSTYKLLRLRTNVKVKSVKAWLSAAGTTITGNLGLYYSDSKSDGTPAADQGTALSAALFASAYAAAAVVEPTEISNQAGAFTDAARQKELWDAAGLSADPGGFFDLVWVSTATAGSAAIINASVDFVP